MNIQPEEIRTIIQKKIENFRHTINVAETGTVVQVGDGIARVFGLDNVMAGEMVVFPQETIGMALNLEQENIGCIIFGDSAHIKEGDIVKRTNKILQVPVGEELLGRVVNPLGKPIDGKGAITTTHHLPIERKALGVIHRQPVKEPLQTGIKPIDTMIPIGRGQRELIIGDRQTGKTAIAIDTIINQKGKDIKCIYVAIGQKRSTIAKIVKTLENHNAMSYTTIVCASASETPALLYMAPYAGCSIGEYFRDKGEHALIIYDDLSKHAAAYREISLLLRRPPGREAFPGDVFYLHSRLLERASKLAEEDGGGSLTALPIVETKAEDISAYIPTNIISITDGQIYLSTRYFYSGIRPAIVPGLSVSRVGGSAQVKAMKAVVGQLRTDLAQYNELEAFSKFGSDLDKTTKQQLLRGEKIIEILKQDENVPLSVEKQIFITFMANNGYLDEIDNRKIKEVEAELYSTIDMKYADFAEKLASGGLTDESRAKMHDICKEVLALHK